MKDMSEQKLVANEIVAAMNRYKQGECTYDRVLEDISIAIDNRAKQIVNHLPITEEIKVGHFKQITKEILSSQSISVDRQFNLSIEIIDLLKKIIK